MTPTTEEVQALLALPDAAREALKGCDGPGWAMSEMGRITLVGGLVDDGTFPQLLESSPRDDRDWLPCDPFDIVEVAADRAGSVAWQAMPHKGLKTLELLVAPPFLDASGTQQAPTTAVSAEKTWALAALVLLAQAWK